MGGEIVIFGGNQLLNTVLYPNAWNLSYSNNQWNWFANPCPIKNSPRGRILLQDNVRLAGNSIFVFGGFVSEDPSRIYLDNGRAVFNDNWEFDLLAGRWWRSWSSLAPKSLMLMTSAVVDDDQLIFFGGSANATLRGVENPNGTNAYMPLDTTWGYHIHTRRWTLYETYVRPSPRVGASLVSVRDGSLLLFGGLSDGQPLNDLWRLTLCENDLSVVSESCAQWVSLGNGEIGPRYYHSVVIVDGHMAVVGGSTTFQDCLHDMWLYDLQTGQWSMRNALGLPKAPMSTCRYLMTSIGSKILVIYQNWTVVSTVVQMGGVDGVTGGMTYSYDMTSSEGWITQAGG